MAFDLSTLRRKNERKPIRATIYGSGGIGKTTFAASAEAPVFLCVEDGLGDLDVPHWDVSKGTFADVMEAIGTLYTDDHDRKTLVIDSLDWLEPKVWAETCARGDVKGPWNDIETPGYGKGYAAATDVWCELIDGLNALRNDRGMHIILIAHSQVKTFNSPETEPYDRHELKLHKGASAKIIEWSDLLLFCNYRTSIVKTDKGFKKTHTRGVSGGDRLGYTNERPAWIAKQRFNLPDSISLDIGFAGILDIINGRVQATEAEVSEAA